MNSGVGDLNHRQDVRAAADQRRDDGARGFERRHEFRDGHVQSGVGDSNHRDDARMVRSNRDEQRNTVRAGAERERTVMNEKQNDSLRTKPR